jgi:hypothetical protein
MLFLDTLQMLKTSGRTGSLSIPVGNSIGKIFFVNGRAEHAFLDTISGDAALLKILTSDSKEPGDFSEGETTPEKSVRQSLDFLMLEAARLRDEGFPAAPAPVAGKVREPWARLTPISDSDSGAFLIAGERAVLGRYDNCDLIVANPAVSKHHCVFENANGEMRVADLNSSNGTFLNGEQIQSSELHYGDMLQFGPVLFRFESPRAAFAMPVAPKVDQNSRTAALQIPPVRASSNLKVKLPNRFNQTDR